MTDTIVTAVLLLLCLGQALSFLLGRVAAVAYFMCAAQLTYFSVWFYATWDPFRLCGLVLLLGFLLLDRRERVLGRLRKHRFICLILYGTSATLVGSFFWPTSYVALSSPVYTTLRALIQIATWLITLGCGWIIGCVLARGPETFRRVERILIIFAVCSCLYGIYQYTANQLQLPHTGTRYTSSEFGAESSVETLPGYAAGGKTYYRINALHGEPKHFAAFCVFMTALLLSQLLLKGFGRGQALALLVCVLALWLTASTSGLLVFTLCIVPALGVITIRYRQFSASMGIRLAAGGASLLLFAGLVTALPAMSEYARQELPAVVSARFAERLEGMGEITAGSWGDVAERLTVEVLKDNPRLALFGTGLGGISYYIAERLGGTALILFPNTGLLGIVANLGLVFLLLLLWVFYRAFKLTGQGAGKPEGVRVRLLLIGSVLWMQMFIFPTSALLCYACGFLLAAEQWRGQPTRLPAPARFPLPSRRRGLAAGWGAPPKTLRNPVREVAQ